jgi:hypothetical protein
MWNKRTIHRLRQGNEGEGLELGQGSQTMTSYACVLISASTKPECPQLYNIVTHEYHSRSLFLSAPEVSNIIHLPMAHYNNSVLSLTTVTTPDPYVTYSAATRQFYLVSYE